MASEVALEGLAAGALRPKVPWWKTLGRVARQKPLGTISAFIILLLLATAVFAPLIAPYDPAQMHLRDKIVGPGLQYWLGTDDVGRDVFSRLVYASRTSLMVGLLAVGIGTSSGSIIGIVSGYFGGKVDTIIQRIADTFMAFPGLIFLMVVVSVLGPGLYNAVLAIALLIWAPESRVVRSAVLAIKQNVYVEAARAIGASNTRILVRHILPNVMAPIIIIASVMLGGAILMEASLRFLNLVGDPTAPSWGGMLSQQGRRFMQSGPWLAIAPGVTISIVVLAFNLLGDALRDVLDPRLRGSQ